MKISHKIAICLLTFLPIQIYAKSTICSVTSEESDLFGIQALTWDEQTKVAKIRDMLGENYTGVVTYTRNHDEGKKTNIYIKFSKPYYGSDAAEFIVFPISENEFRVIGVTYILRNNKQLLSILMENDPATCVSI
jgi:dihydrodipicolinate reductase